MSSTISRKPIVLVDSASFAIYRVCATMAWHKRAIKTHTPDTDPKFNDHLTN